MLLSNENEDDAKVVADCIHSSRVKEVGMTLLKDHRYVVEEGEGKYGSFDNKERIPEEEVRIIIVSDDNDGDTTAFRTKSISTKIGRITSCITTTSITSKESTGKEINTLHSIVLSFVSFESNFTKKRIQTLIIQTKRFNHAQ